MWIQNNLFDIICEQPGIKITHCMNLQVREMEEKRSTFPYRKRRRRKRMRGGFGGGVRISITNKK